jgi:hypothetical protein
MAGKRQHFIPQFIQSGFASHVSGDEIYTWVYRKEAKPFNTNIIKMLVLKVTSIPKTVIIKWMTRLQKQK